jgi:D-alanyl-D-alanine carboxypeptidase
LNTDITSALIAAQETAPETRDVEPVRGGIPLSLRPAMRPAEVSASTAVVQSPENEVVTRLSTSGGHQWGVNVGRYGSRHLAERALLTTALTEMETLDGTLRKVVQRSGGFDANFLGMSRESADLACRRLEARNINCETVGPSS